MTLGELTTGGGGGGGGAKSYDSEIAWSSMYKAFNSLWAECTRTCDSNEGYR